MPFLSKQLMYHTGQLIPPQKKKLSFSAITVYTYKIWMKLHVNQRYAYTIWFTIDSILLGISYFLTKVEISLFFCTLNSVVCTNVLQFLPPSEFNYVKPVLKVFSNFFVYTSANGERRFKTLYFYLKLSLLIAQ